MSDHPTRREILLAGAALSVATSQSLAETAAVPAPAPLSKTPLPQAPAPQAQERAIATGRVRERRTVAADPAGTLLPLADVLVSNGRDVVRTDADGRYSLSVAPGEAIFVIKPAGFAVPVDPETQLPRFFYVHDPAGTPDSLAFRYGGLPPSGPLPPSVDFEFRRQPEPQTFDVLLFTDPQPESALEVSFIRDDVVAGLVGNHKAAFGITCGDIAFDDLSMYDRINRIVGRLGVPWWTVGGNHDLDFEAPDMRRARDTYKRVFGPPAYAHEYGKAVFIMLDNVDYFGASHPRTEDHPNYRGYLPPDQLAFVENVLKLTPADRLIVLVMHIPLQTYLGNDPSRSTVNAADLLRLLGDRPAVSFAGHTHSTEHHYIESGAGGRQPHHHHVLTAVSGAWWSGPHDHRGIAAADSYDGTPNGYHVLSIDGLTYTTRYVPAAEPSEAQMRLSLESEFHQDDRNVVMERPMVELLRSPITQAQVGGTRLVVNLFDGGPKSNLLFAIDGHPPVAMRRVARPDPFFQQVFQRRHETFKKWVMPQASSHLWVAPLPRHLGIGTYKIDVAARDEYGRAHRSSMILEVI
jgi:hypothetical protein